MKKVLFILISIYFISCSKKNTPRTIKNIQIIDFKQDNTSIRAIQSIDNNTVFYAGSKGDIGFSNNSGKTWSINKIKYQDSIIPHFRSIAYNKKDIFVLSIGNPALLYKFFKGKFTLVYSENHKKVFYDSMHFFADGKNGIAVGDPTDNYPSIIITSDGGNYWKKVDTKKLPKFEEGEAFFAASNTNIKILNNSVWIVSGGKKSRVLKSNDKGKTWKIYDTPIVQGENHQGIYSIDFYDEKNGIIIGGSYVNPNNNCYNKAITKDGGKTWKLIANNVNPSYKSCVKYVPNTNGKEIFAVGKTGISFSNDSGKTWKEVSKEAYYSIQFTDKNNAWLSGNNKIGKLILK